MDYNKYLYEQKAKAKKIRAKKTKLKEFRLGPNTSDGDIQIRIERGKEFLQQGNMVKYTVKFKRRENLFPEQGITKLKIIESELASCSRIDTPIKRMGNMMYIVLSPASTKGTQQNG